MKVWSNTTLLLSDERLVEENSVESNMGMIKYQLIDKITVDTYPSLVPIVNGYQLEKSNQIIEMLNIKAKPLLPPTAAFLGVGKDGHTASLFPDSEYDFICEDPFIIVERVSEPFKRVSLSATVLTQTPFLFFLVSGKEKQPIIDHIFNASKDDLMLPVQSIIQHAKADILLLCDQQAAAI